MATPDCSTWFTKQQAADAIGVSTKTIESLTKDGKLEAARYRRPDGGPELAVYNPDDVARIAAERHPTRPAFVLPAVTPPANGNGRHTPPATALAVAQPGAAGAFDVRAFLESLIAAAISQSAETSQSSQKSTLFLTVPEAAAWSGLSPTYLKRAIASGSIQAVKDGRSWRIRRRDLEQL